MMNERGAEEEEMSKWKGGAARAGQRRRRGRGYRRRRPQ